jgi:hypothetical protein
MNVNGVLYFNIDGPTKHYGDRNGYNFKGGIDQLGIYKDGVLYKYRGKAGYECFCYLTGSYDYLLHSKNLSILVQNTVANESTQIYPNEMYLGNLVFDFIKGKLSVKD